jgi:hypothetical protein
MHDWRFCVVVAMSPVDILVVWLLLQWILMAPGLHLSPSSLRVTAVSVGVVIWMSIALYAMVRLGPRVFKEEIRKYFLHQVEQGKGPSEPNRP